jgi:hypothetical protein
MPQALQADMQARRIHHHEHRGQAAIGVADQPASSTVEDQGTGGAALDAHLVFMPSHRTRLAVVE